ncbi:hypothetical protein Tco_0449149 [Tanacetum coccineum]
MIPLNVINHMMSFLMLSSLFLILTINQGDNTSLKKVVKFIHERNLAVLADPGIPEGQVYTDCHNSHALIHVLIWMHLTLIVTILTLPSCSHGEFVFIMVQTALSETNLENKSVNDTLTAELKRYKEQVKVLKEGKNVDLRSHDNVSDSCAQFVKIDHLKRTLLEHLKEKESLLQTVTILKNDFKKEESRNLDREISLEKQIKHLDNTIFKRDQSAQTVHMLTKPQFFYDNTTKQALGFQNLFYLKKAQQLEPMLYVGDIIQKTSPIVIPDSEETLTLTKESHSKML